MTSEPRLMDPTQERQTGWNGAESMAQDEDGMQEGESHVFQSCISSNMHFISSVFAAHFCILLVDSIFWYYVRDLCDVCWQAQAPELALQYLHLQKLKPILNTHLPA
jgi:hypothetical protein